MIDVVIIGSGGVAEHLAREVANAAELRLVQIFARNCERGRLLAKWGDTKWSNNPTELAPADIYIMSVSDCAVAPLSASLPFPRGAVVAHTAGCVALDEMDSGIANRAVLYPLQSFTMGERIADFRQTPLFIEGASAKALELVGETARALSDHVIEMDSARRATLHLAGSFANNFPNLMFSIAEQIVDKIGVPFDHIKPIIAHTVAKAICMPSPKSAQTGPAQRGDMVIQTRHIAMLQTDHPQYVDLYKLLSQTIWKISKRNLEK